MPEPIEQDTEPTPTVFRVFPEGDVIALFPADAAGSTYGDCTSYMHVGQHSAADYHHVVASTRPAEPEEYESLLRELEQVGYRPKVYRREQRQHHRSRMDEHHRLAREARGA